MVPEQADDTHAVDIRADIYSFDCKLYALLAANRRSVVRNIWIQDVSTNRSGLELPADAVRSGLAWLATDERRQDYMRVASDILAEKARHGGA